MTLLTTPDLRLVNEAARLKFKEALAEIAAENPDVSLFHGVFFIFGIDADGKALPNKEEIMNTFGPDIEGLQACITTMQNILDGYKEQANAPHQTH